MLSRPPYSPNANAVPTQTVITFDNLVDGTVIDTYYAAKGVTFQSYLDMPAQTWSAYARFTPVAESPRNVISINDATMHQQTPPPATITPFFSGDGGRILATFSTPQRYVSIDALAVLPPEWSDKPVARPFLETYDAQGDLIDQIFYAPAYGNSAYFTWQSLFALSSSTNIVAAKFSTEPAPYHGTKVSALFDRLVFVRYLSPIRLGLLGQ